MKTTFEKIKSFKPCESGWEKLISYYKPDSLEEEVTIKEIIKSNGIKDAVWALRAVDNKKLIMLFCADVAESCLSNYTKFFPEDTRVSLCIEAVRKFANDEIKESELKLAESAAESASWSASLSAWSAAWSAAWAARSAAESTAAWAVRSSTWSAESVESAAESDAWNNIEQILNKYL